MFGLRSVNVTKIRFESEGCSLIAMKKFAVRGLMLFKFGEMLPNEQQTSLHLRAINGIVLS